MRALCYYNVTNHANHMIGLDSDPGGPLPPELPPVVKSFVDFMNSLGVPVAVTMITLRAEEDPNPNDTNSPDSGKPN